MQLFISAWLMIIRRVLTAELLLATAILPMFALGVGKRTKHALTS